MSNDSSTEPRSRSDIAVTLRTRGILPTQQRLEIATLLLREPQHLSAEQILTQARDRGLAVSKATVYNTLGLLARHGLIREVFIDPAKIFYDSNTASHHHFYDITTGTLTDIAADRVSVNGVPQLPLGTVVEGVDVVVRVRSGVDGQ